MTLNETLGDVVSADKALLPAPATRTCYDHYVVYDFDGWCPECLDEVEDMLDQQDPTGWWTCPDDGPHGPQCLLAAADAFKAGTR